MRTFRSLPMLLAVLSVTAARAEGAPSRTWRLDLPRRAVGLPMMSNHFPPATYGSRWGWVVLCAMVLVGWATARRVRRA